MADKVIVVKRETVRNIYHPSSGGGSSGGGGGGGGGEAGCFICTVIGILVCVALGVASFSKDGDIGVAMSASGVLLFFLVVGVLFLALIVGAMKG